MAPDYRSDKSESAEGKGRARAAWEAYARGVNKAGAPLMTPLIRRLAASQTADMMGFWMMWHLYGGFEGLEELGMHRTTIFRKINRFRTYFKTHPDEYRLEGVDINAAKFWKAVARKNAQ